MGKQIKFFQSNCIGEGMTVEYVPDEHGDEFWLTYWEVASPLTSSNSNWGFWSRLKMAWHIIRKGMPWSDMIIFDRKTAKNVAYHILYRLEQNEDAPDQINDVDKLF